MKKMGWLIRNIYRIRITKAGSSTTVNVIQHELPANDADKILKNILRSDKTLPEPDPELRSLLEQRVARKGKGTTIKSNSMARMFFPVLSMTRSIELKMAAITFALAMFMRICPVVNHQINRNIQPSFLADTLIDSSSLNHTLPDIPIKIR